MKTLQVRNVPDDTHAILRERAAAARMSLQEYLLDTLTEFAKRPTVAEVLDRAAAQSSGRAGLADAAADVREDCDAG